MDNIAYKYNRFLITIFVITPFAAWFSWNILQMDFNRVMQFLSYIGVFLLLIFKKEANSIKFPKYLLFYLLFILYVFYSTFVQLDRDFQIKYLFSNRLIGGLNYMFIIENLPISKKYYNILLGVSIKILIIAFFVIIFQQVIDPSFFMRMDYGSIDLVIGVSENRNRLLSIYSWAGGLPAVGFSFVPIFILIVENLERKKKHILIWILMGLTFAILTKARWIMLIVLMVFPILIINQKQKIKIVIKYLFLLPLIVYISFLALDFVGINIEGIVNERILETDKKGFDQKSASTRLLAFKAFNKFYWDNPFFGVGDIKYGMGGTDKQEFKLERFLGGRSSQIHVGYLSLLYMYGLVGALFFLSFLFLLLKKLYKSAEVTGIWAPFLGFLGLAIANLTLVNFEVFYMGFIIVLVADRYYNQEIKKNIND